MRTILKNLQYLLSRSLIFKVFEKGKIYLKSHRGYNPIVIYQMGKVGSMTIYETIRKYTENPVFHVHFLSPNEIERVSKKYTKAGVVREPHHMRDSRLLSNYLKASRSINWYIITLVRDPISAKMSHLFHNPKVHHQYLFDEEGNLDEERALNVTYKSLMDFNPKSDFVCNWINNEFCTYLRVDLYQYPFNKEQGFQIIDVDKYKVLVLQTESIDKALVNALKEMKIINDDIQVIRSNENENKEFSKMYNFVKSNIKVPDNKINEIYNSKYVRHFYNDVFISKKIEQWVN